MSKKTCQKSFFLVLFSSHGEIAQLARASGSYPAGREFESPSRYQMTIKRILYQYPFLFCLFNIEIIEPNNMYHKN